MFKPRGTLSGGRFGTVSLAPPSVLRHPSPLSVQVETPGGCSICRQASLTGTPISIRSGAFSCFATFQYFSKSTGIATLNSFAGCCAVQEICVYGLRNPYEFSFDRLPQRLSDST